MDGKRLEEQIKKSGTMKSFSEKMGIAESTLYRKLGSGNFSVSEAAKAVEILGLQNEEAYAIFFRKKLA